LLSGPRENDARLLWLVVDAQGWEEGRAVAGMKETLQEILGDPDAGLELRPEFEERLRREIADVSSDGRLLSVQELSRQLRDTGAVRNDVSQ